MKLTKELKSQRVIYICLTGGLGNQLFQYAVALAQNPSSIINLSEIGNPRLNAKGNPEIFSFNLPVPIKQLDCPKFKKFCSRVFGYQLRSNAAPKKIEKYAVFQHFLQLLTSLIFSVLYRKRMKIVACKGVGFSESRLKGNLFVGYFQSHKYFESRTTLDRLKQINLAQPGKEYERLLLEARAVNPLIIHVRLGDYKAETNFGIPSDVYYLNGLDLLLSTQKFQAIWLFSDERDLAMEFIPEKFRHVVKLIDEVDNSPSSTLQLMREGSGYLIANSTFSWWAAKLSNNPNSMVVYPRPWFKNMESPIQMSPNSWIGLSAYN